MSAEDEVRQASEKFYAALNRMANGDSGPMAEVWLQGAEVTAMHPIGGRDEGWDAVRTSFEQVAGLATDGKIDVSEQLIRVDGDFAYETAVERGHLKLAGNEADIEHRVTNIYRRQGGAWKMVHHHTDTSPAMLEILSRLPAPG